MDVVLRVAPGVRLLSSASGIRASTPAGTPVLSPDVLHGPGRGETSTARRERSTPPPVTLAELEERSRAAQLAEDVMGLTAVEEALASLHLQSRPPRRQPEPDVDHGLTSQQRSAARRAAFRAALAPVSFLRLGARQQARTVANQQADRFLAAADVGSAVLSQHQSAVVADAWHDLADHDRVRVIAELDADFAREGSGCTCVDAGWAEEGRRSYVTVIARYAALDIVSERGPGVSSSGRRMLRRRTQAERNGLYLTGLASFALATVRHAISVSVTADDVHLVIVRPPADGPGLEPIYVGSLSREGVTLRPALADPVPLFLGGAMRQMRFSGPAHDLVALEPDKDVAEIIRRCGDALGDIVPETVLGPVPDLHPSER